MSGKGASTVPTYGQTSTHCQRGAPTFLSESGFPERHSFRMKTMHRQRVPTLAALLLVTLCTACVTTRHTFLDPSAPRYDPVSPDSVRILTHESELDSLDYSRVAVIEATGSGEFTNQIGMLEAMRKKAGELGANAILLPQIEEPGAGAKVAAAVFGTGTQRKGSVVAIRIHGNRKGR